MVIGRVCNIENCFSTLKIHRIPDSFDRLVSVCSDFLFADIEVRSGFPIPRASYFPPCEDCSPPNSSGSSNHRITLSSEMDTLSCEIRILVSPLSPSLFRTLNLHSFSKSSRWQVTPHIVAPLRFMQTPGKSLSRTCIGIIYSILHVPTVEV